MKKLPLLLNVLLFSTTAVIAEVKLPSVLSDNMVLQQNTDVAVWGTADPDEEIVVKPSWTDKEIRVRAAHDGKWKTSIKTPKASEGHSISINEKSITNILIGEVWLCSGQSNMDFKLAKDPAAKWQKGIFTQEEELKDTDYPSIRLFKIPQKLSPEKELDDCEGEWVIADAKTAGDFSAVGFLFGRNIYKEIKQPVGLIQASWGSTHAESWTKRDVIENDTVYNSVLEQQAKEMTEYPSAQAEYKVKLAAYEAAVKEAEQRGEKTQMKKPSGPKNPNNVKTASTLWNAMIHPVVPYTVKGAIWYQGESNSIRHFTYTRVMNNMIESWRTEFNNPKMPFYFVQIAPHYKQPAEIREAQLMTFQQIKYTGMAVITDAGDSTDIHPRNKVLPAERLSRWALKNEYGRKVEACGPVYKSMKVKGDKAILSFDYTAKGLKADGGELKGFEVAGDDGVFYPALAKIDGKRVIVYSDKVNSPTDVRYGWGKFFRVNLYNEAGLPASPFRTGK